MRSTLQELGLNLKEIDVYLALLDMGKASASVIAYRTNIPASTVHYICKKLNEKGLVSFSKEHHSIAYCAESPDKILYLYEQQKEDLKRRQIRAARVIAEMKAKMHPEDSLPKINLCEGMKGVEKIFDGIMKQPENLCVFMGGEMENGRNSFHFDSKYLHKRLQNNIQIKAIALKNSCQNDPKTDQGKQFTEIRFLDDNHPLFDTEINIYGDNVAFISYKNNNTFGALIENASMAQSMQTLFDFYWQAAK